MQPCEPTSTKYANEKLRKLFQAFESLNEFTSRISIEELTDRLGTLHLTREDVSPFAHFSDSCYQRNLMFDGTCFRALLLCWKSGQRSPIHNHLGSNCFVRVVQGTATEIQFKKSACGMWSPCAVNELSAGGVCASTDEDTHIIGNFQEPGSDLITLHVYTPPLLGMQIVEIADTIFDDDDGIIERSLASANALTASDWERTRKSPQ